MMSLVVVEHANVHPQTPSFLLGSYEKISENAKIYELIVHSIYMCERRELVIQI